MKIEPFKMMLAMKKSGEKSYCWNRQRCNDNDVGAENNEDGSENDEDYAELVFLISIFFWVELIV